MPIFTHSHDFSLNHSLIQSLYSFILSLSHSRLSFNQEWWLHNSPLPSHTLPLTTSTTHTLPLTSTKDLRSHHTRGTNSPSISSLHRRTGTPGISAPLNPRPHLSDQPSLLLMSYQKAWLALPTWVQRSGSLTTPSRPRSHGQRSESLATPLRLLPQGRRAALSRPVPSLSLRLTV